MQFTQQEIQWLLDARISRLSDGHEVMIYPMGAERYLSSVLFGKPHKRYPLHREIEGKRVLVIPGYGNSGFLFAKAGAIVTVYDQDPVTIAWLKAFKKFYHYRPQNPKGQSYPSIAECLDALTQWYPPYLKLPTHRFANRIYWILQPQFLRQAYIFYIIALVQEAIKTNIGQQFELDLPLTFHAGDIDQLIQHEVRPFFDTAYVPYLLGIKNGIESETDIVNFMQKLFQCVPEGKILVTPSKNTREFYIVGQRYFETTPYSNLELIPGLAPHVHHIDKKWFHTQGLIIFRTA